MFRKILDEGQAGDNVGLLLRGIDKNEIKRGMVLCHPGQIKPFKKFKASIYVLKKEEGAVTLRSATSIVLSSTSAPWTAQVRLLSPQVLRW